jgi:O-Antigen ligase
VLETDGTLDYPLGYRNAEAAFFGIALFPAVGLAATAELDWRLRAAALATATLCIDLFLLAQSRASAPAMVVALVTFTLLSPLRVRALAWLALAVLPAIAIFPAEVALFHASADGVRDVASEMHRAGIVAAVTTAVALVLGGLAARHERRLPGLRSATPDSNRRVRTALIALAVVTVVGFVAAVGNPVTWIGDRADEFKSAGSPDLSSHASRFTFNAGSERYDLWRVAIDDAIDDPLFGDGGGGYQYSYLRHRDSTDQYVHDAHSVELELLSELGIVGLALFVVAVVAAARGAVRSRRLGPSAANLTAIALASGAYWLVHTSVDWFWPYPAITAPLLALIGSACAPAIRLVGRRSTRNWRRWATVALAALALSAIPFWLSERFINNAYTEWRDDLPRAYSDLDRAHSLDPFDDMPLLAEASIAEAAGDHERSLSALREAAEKRPEEWATHYLLAKGLMQSNPRLARNEIRVALELNPLGVDARALARRLQIDPDTGSVTVPGSAG